MRTLRTTRSGRASGCLQTGEIARSVRSVLPAGPPAEVHDRPVARGREQVLDGLVVRVLADVRRRRDPLAEVRQLDLGHFGASGVGACSVKRICIFGALRYTRICPSKTASRKSLSQLTTTALP